MGDSSVEAASCPATAYVSECCYAVYCKPRQEVITEDNLLRQSYVYLTRIHNTRRYGENGQVWSTVVRALPVYSG